MNLPAASLPAVGSVDAFLSFIHRPLVYQYFNFCSPGVALAVNDFSGAVMTSSTNDDNSTKELKGYARKFNILFLFQN